MPHGTALRDRLRLTTLLPGGVPPCLQTTLPQWAQRARNAGYNVVEITKPDVSSYTVTGETTLRVYSLYVTGVRNGGVSTFDQGDHYTKVYVRVCEMQSAPGVYFFRENGLGFYAVTCP